MHGKNIVFVLNEYNGTGGAQRVASILAKDFVQDGHNVSVLSINEQVDKPNYFHKEIPIKVLHPSGYRATKPLRISSNLKALKFRKVKNELKRRYLLEKKRKEVVEFFNKYGTELVYVIVIQVYGMQWLEPLIYKSNVKMIGQSHESYEASKDSARFKRVLKYYRQIDKFLLLTNKDKLKFDKHGFINTGYIYNPSTFSQKTDPKKLFENRTIASSGRLVEGKGFDILIEAFARIADEIPQWKLNIYGDGPAKEDLLVLIEALGLKNRVFLKGEVNDMKSALTSSSIFVLTSRAEGLPMSLIEAQSCGLPCISTDCAPGIKEIIKEYESGYLSPIDDVHVISRHINRLVSNKDCYISFSEQAYKHSAIFEVSNIKQKWYQIFEEVGGLKDDASSKTV
ncbi:glycosyltransferase [Virgibacillus dokdonensis]|uniref:glycosyltransferase n=1 Tax=Virgibacillus dokdonensis TaxID=302167 RepID=UPI000989DB50|nr:glycosyltransferase [Virgibacillus dokdonensis]